MLTSLAFMHKVSAIEPIINSITPDIFYAGGAYWTTPRV